MRRGQTSTIDKDIVERPVPRSKTGIEVKWAINARNSNPVSRLPPEILVVIFLALKDEHLVFDGSWSMENMDWVRVTHVCHHWRAIALKSPTLWTTLLIKASLTRQYQWASLALHRSKHALLTAYVECMGHPDSTKTANYTQILSSLGQNLSRCRDLTLLFMDDTSCPPFELFQQNHAPQLQFLSILLHEDQEPGLTHPFVLSDGTLETPNLKHLKLSNCRVDWHAALFQSITHLNVSRMFLDPLDLPDFVSLLARMPSLKELDTDMTFLSGDVPLNTWSQKPTLHSLAKISLQSVLEIAVAFLLSFITSCTNVHIITTYSNTNLDSTAPLEFYEQVNRLLDVLSHHLPRTDTNDARKHLLLSRMTMCFYQSGLFSIQAYDTLYTPPDIPSTRYSADYLNCSADAAMHIDINSASDWNSETRPLIPPNSGLQGRIIRSICTSLPFDELVSITLDGAFTFDASVWVETFGRISSLRKVVLGTNIANIQAFFDTLVHGVEDTSTVPPVDTEMTRKIPFRSLTSIIIHTNSYPLGSVLVDSMEPILQKRETIGLPLELAGLVLPYEYIMLRPGGGTKKGIRTRSRITANISGYWLEFSATYITLGERLDPLLAVWCIVTILSNCCNVAGA